MSTPFQVPNLGNPLEGIMQMFEGLRPSFEKRAGTRMGRGDVRAAVLGLLAEQPMHGYQIIREIEKRSGGSWKPSAGSVYPTLQLLVDEGLLTAEESDGRKTYSLTEAGLAESEESGDAPWASASATPHKGFPALAKAGMDLAQATAAVGRTGDAELVAEAVEILEDSRRKLYAILARE